MPHGRSVVGLLLAGVVVDGPPANVQQKARAHHKLSTVISSPIHYSTPLDQTNFPCLFPCPCSLCEYAGQPHYSHFLILPVSPSLVAALVQPLRDVVVVMPGAVKRGTNVVLQCRYDLEGDSLYSVKWYKGRREFFHYTPKEIPPVRTFPAQGVQINVSPIRTWSFSHPTPTIQDERW